MTRSASHRLPLLAPSLGALLIILIAAVATAQPAPEANGTGKPRPTAKREKVTPPEEIVVEVPPDVKAVLSRKAKARKVDLDGTGILWITGKLADWGTGDAEAVRKWVSMGHVAWVDMGLASLYGATPKRGAGVDSAVVASGAEGHALVEGVSSVMCGDSFIYVRDMPRGAQAILTEANCAVHAIAFVWPVGKGAFIFRPEQRSANTDWTTNGYRCWIEPDMADGRRFLANVSAYSLKILRDAGWVAEADPATATTGGAVQVRRGAVPPRVHKPLPAERGPRSLGHAFHLPGD